MPERKTKGMPNPNDIIIGKRLRQFRKEAGLSQTELGDKLGISFQQIQKYERGVNRISAGRMTQIVDALGISVWTLFPNKYHPDNGKEISLLDKMRVRMQKLENFIEENIEGSRRILNADRS